MYVRLIGLVLVSVLVTVLCPAVFAQGDQPADRERLQREQAEQFRQLGQQVPPGAQAFTIMVGGEGGAQVRRVGGPLDPALVPAEMHLVGERLYVVRGFTLHQFRTGDELEALCEVDLRTEDEIAAGPPPPGMIIGRPDPAAVPVSLKFSEDGARVFVLRGYMLRQFAAEGLELVAEFDLRSQEERNRPRMEMRMGPAGPPPPGAQPPPPPPQ